MLKTDKQKLCLCGWLRTQNPTAYYNPFKLQMFLFLYEVFLKTFVNTADFSNIEGFLCGPIYRNVWDDIIHNNSEFNKTSIEALEKCNNININFPIAKKCSFITGAMAEKELADFCCRMNIWKAKQDQIIRNEPNILLDEKDFNDNDTKMIRALDSIFPNDMIQNSVCMPINGIYFVFSQNDYKKISGKTMSALLEISSEGNLHNPVFVEFDDEGMLVINP